jgi:hypothetical protein
MMQRGQGLKLTRQRQPLLDSSAVFFAAALEQTQRDELQRHILVIYQLDGSVHRPHAPFAQLVQESVAAIDNCAKPWCHVPSLEGHQADSGES